MRPANDRTRTRSDRALARQRASRRKTSLRLLGFDEMESRVLLSTVFWNTDASGAWNVAANWQDDQGVHRVPGASDDVVISRPSASPTVTFNTNSASVKSLTAQDPVVIAGGSLTVTAGASQINSSLSITAGATLTASNSGTSFQANGAAVIDGANLYATAGAVLSFPNLTSYAGPTAGFTSSTIQASGTASRVDLSHLSSLTGATANYGQVNVKALAGGVVSLHNVASNPGGAIALDTEGTGSSIDLSRLTVIGSTTNYNSSLTATTGGTILDPLLTTLNLTDLTTDGTGTLATAQVNTFAGGTITATGGTPSYVGLTNIDGANLYASGGGTLAFPNVASYAGTTSSFTSSTIQASGTASHVDLSHVTSLTGVTGNYGQVNVKALAGGAVSLGSVTTNPAGAVAFDADGAGSVIDLSRLTVIGSTTNYDSSLTATTGGTILDPLLTTLNLTDLTTDGTGTLATAQVNTFAGGTITATGGTPSYVGLTNIDGANLYASGGAVLAFPNLASYAGPTAFDVSSTIQASGTGSRVDLSHLTSLTGATGSYSEVNLKALAGGAVSLHNVVTNPSGAIALDADGPGSFIDLSKLTAIASTINYDSSLTATTGGTILDPILTTLAHTDLSTDGTGTLGTAQITTFAGGTITATGGTPDYSGLTNIDGDNVYASGGAVLAFPNVASYAGPTAFDTSSTIQASGTGSRVDLSHLTSLTGATGSYSQVNLKALAGGAESLHNVTSNPAGTLAFDADGTGSTIDLSRLTAIASTTNYDSSLTATNGGAITLTSGLISLSHVDVSAATTGTISAGTLLILPGGSLSGDSTILANVVSAAQTSPGVNAAGVLTVAGNFSQYGASTLNIQVGGPTVGTQYDQLAVTGSAQLAGTLSVTYLNSYAPAVGNSFAVLTYGSSSGEFAVETGLSYGSGQTLQTVVGSTNFSLVGALAGIRVFPTTTLLISKAGDSTSFTVALATQPVANVVIHVSSSNTSEGIVSPGSLTFTPANWNVAQTVTITGVNDHQAGTASYQVVFAPAASADPNYSGLTTPALPVTNLASETEAIQVGNLAVSPATGLNPGSNLAVTWVDSNTGNLPAIATWDDHVVITNTTTGAILTTADVLTDPTVEGTLAPGSSLAQQFAFTLPVGTNGTGNIQVTVTADAYHGAFEHGTSLANANLRSYTAGTDFPTTPSTLSVGGVDFALVPDPGVASSLGVIQTPGSGSSFDIPVNIAGATTLYTLIDSTYGVAGDLVGTVEVKGTNGADAVFQLVEGTNIRDFYNGGYDNTIAAGTPFVSFNNGQVRLDMQTFVLPAAFANARITDIILNGSGGNPQGDPFLAAATVATASGPAQLVLLGSGVAPDITTSATRTVSSGNATPGQVSLVLDPASDSGVKGDNLTDIKTPTFDVTVNEAGTIRIDYKGDGTLISTLAVGAAASYPFTAPTLADGGYPVQVTFTPSFGAVATATLGVTIDTRPPTLLAGTASAPGPLFTRTLLFSENIDASTISVAAILVSGAGITGSVHPTSVIGSGTTFVVTFPNPLIAGGSYSIQLGAGIADLAGNPLGSGVADSFQLIPDATSPTITAVTPSGPTSANVSSLSVTFNKLINPTTFTSGQVVITGPAGTIPTSSITVVEVDAAHYTINFPTQSQEASYSVSIGGSGVRDISGNAMTAAYRTGFIIDRTAPTVGSVTPAGTVNQVVTFLDITFSKLMNVSSLNGSTISVTGPGGPVAVGAGFLVSGTTYQIPIASSRLNGTYQIAIGTGAVDLAGLGLVAASTASFTVSLPDLVVSQVSAAGSALPGQQVVVGWTLGNTGTAPASGSWTEQIFLASDAAGDNPVLLAAATFSGSLAVGQAVARSATVAIPVVSAGSHWLVVAENPFGEIDEANTTNNSAVGAQPLTIAGTLTLALAATTVSDAAGASATTATVTRNTPTTAALVVAIGNSDPHDVTVPQTVTIPAGSTSVSFPVGTINNHAVEGTQTATITATAPGLLAGTAGLNITDTNVPALTLVLNSHLLDETDANPATFGTLTRNTATTGPLVVSLLSNAMTKLAVPATVTIPAGQTSVTFPVTVLNDGKIDGNITATVTASAPSFVAGTESAVVVDDNIPTLGLALAQTTVSEASPNPATTGTVTIAHPATGPITIILASGDPTTATVPPSVIIAPGQLSATFPITVVDDGLVTGDKTAVITARIETSAGVVLDQGSAEAALTVKEADGPALTLSFLVAAVNKGTTATATLTRNTSTASPLVVTLVSGDPARATVPATVTIPAGQASVTFAVAAVDDHIPDGLQTVQIFTAAAGFAPGIGALSITDVDLPDLVVASVTAPATGYDNTPLPITWTVTNTGQYPASGSWTDEVFLDPVGGPASTSPAATVTYQGTIAAGQSYSQADTLAFPSTVGQYRVRVVADTSQGVEELSFTNNSGTTLQPITDQALYSATVGTTATTVSLATPIVLAGVATLTGTNGPAAGVPVAVRIMVAGTTRTLTATTDSGGHYSITFQPLADEAGAYTVTASDPGVTNPPVQARFQIIGMTATPANGNVKVVPNTPLVGQITLTNLGNLALTGLTATASGGPAGLITQVTPPGQIVGNGTATLSYSLDATSTLAASGVVTIHVATAQGAVVDILLGVAVTPLLPILATTPGSLNAGMVVGTQSLISFTVVNNGGSPSGDLTIALPSTPYLSLASPATIPSLAPGASSQVSLELSPAASLPLLRYAGTIALSSKLTGISIPFTFTAVTSSTGNVQVLVDDDYTFQEAGSPRVAGATVSLLNPYDNTDVVATATTDATGAVTLSNVPAGPYLLQVQASGHSAYDNSYTVVPGITNSDEVFVARQFVTYTWNVQQTTIQDSYQIKLQTTFLTNVPAPVVTITAPAALPTLQPGQSASFNVTLTNHGLIAAQGVTLDLPTDPDYTFTALTTQIGVLPAQSSVVVPVTVTRVAPQSLTITDGGAVVNAKVVVPGPLAASTASTVYVTYSNTGTVAIPAPLLVLSATENGNSGAFLSLDPALAGLGYNANATPAGFGPTVQFLASGATPGMIEPGETVTIPVDYAGWSASLWTSSPVTFSLSRASADDSQAIDWAAVAPGLRLGSINQAAWDAITPTLTAQLGSTWGQYVQTLDNDAAYLAGLGEPTTDLSQLLSFEIEKANAGYTAQTLTTATAADLPAPGLNLSFVQSFQQSISGRYTAGILGFGWTTNWDITATTMPNGDVSIDEDGLSRYFSLRPGGTFAPEAGDQGSSLTAVAGGYRIVESTGTVYQFNPDGTLHTVQDTHANTITAAYDNQGRYASLTASNGEFLRFTYNAQGRLATLTDSNSQTETYGYDPTGGFLTHYTDLDGTTSYTYVTGQSAAQNNALAEITRANNTHTYFGYDAQGRLTDEHRDGGQEDQTWTYLTPGGFVLTDADNHKTTVYFDRYGATPVTIDPLGNVTRSSFDTNLDLTQVVGPGGSTYRFTYDANGNVTSQTDPLGLTTIFTYNAHNNLTSYTDAKGNTTQYGYDSANDLQSITYANGTAQTFAYNPLGEATQYLNARGQAVGYTYTLQGLVATETFADGTSYSFTYGGQGNLASATDTSGAVTTFVYANPANPDLLTEVEYPDGTYLKFTYNIVGQRTQSVDQTGFTVNYGYDTLGRLAILTNGTGNLIVQYTYDPAGNLIQKDMGNGTRTVYTYDGDGAVLSITNDASIGGPVNSFDTYTYNALGNVLTDTNQDGQWAYAYDADSQLIGATFTPNATNPDGLTAQNIQYVYDPAGNRKSETINGVTTTYVVNNVNEYTSSTTNGVNTNDQYDADGNLLAQTTGGTTTSYTFNALNQMTAVTGPGLTASYRYDPLGNRVAQTVNGLWTGFQIDPIGLGNVVATESAPGALAAHFTYAFGLVSQVNPAGISDFYDFNNIGSTIGVTGTSGRYVNSYAYLPFGQAKTIAAAVANPFVYVGALGIQDNGTGILNMRARNFDPTSGHFVSSDPIGLHSGETDLYRYAANNPTLNADPTGEWCIIAGRFQNGGPNNFLGFTAGHSVGFSAGLGASAGVGATAGFGPAAIVGPSFFAGAGFNGGIASGGGLGFSGGVGAFATAGLGVSYANSVGAGLGYSHGSTDGVGLGIGWGGGCPCHCPPSKPPTPDDGSCTLAIDGIYYYICDDEHVESGFAVTISVSGRDCSAIDVEAALDFFGDGGGGIPPEIFGTANCNPVLNNLGQQVEQASNDANDPPINTAPAVKGTDQAADALVTSSAGSPLSFLATALGNLGMLAGQSGNLGGSGGSPVQLAATIATFDQTETDLAGIFATAAGSGGTIGIAGDMSLLQGIDARLLAVTAAENALFGGDANWLDTNQSATLRQWLTAFFADAQDGSDGGEQISPAEMTQLLTTTLPTTVSVSEAAEFVDRWNRTVEYWGQGIFTAARVPAGQSTDFLDASAIRTAFDAAEAATHQSQADGYADPMAELQGALVEVQTDLAGQGVCATIKLQIGQDATLTRSAFSGTLTITNSEGTGSMTNVVMDLNITDASGKPANGEFFISSPTYSGAFVVANGQATLPDFSTGSISFTFIPTDTAASSAPTIYRIGGTIGFTDPSGGAIELSVFPSTITVYPQASLQLNYFLQEDVIGDDPFTPQVEPSEPSTLGLLVTNVGGGTATNLAITTAQPQIVQNEKGLLDTFQIIGTQVGNQAETPSLTVNLGDIASGQTADASFQILSMLQGVFENFSATFTHSNALGGLETSLIQSVTTHELTHAGNFAYPGGTGATDYLVNDIPDPQSLPDTIYFSNGTTAPVNVASNALSSVVGAGGQLTYQVTASVSSGWDYLQLADPGAGYTLYKVVRSDGTVIPVTDQAWTTDRTIAANGRATVADVLHILDDNSTGSYIVSYRPTSATSPTVASISPVSSPQSGSIASVAVTFSEVIDPTTFTTSNLALTLNGGPNLINSSVTITQVSPTQFTIGGLAAITAANGNYTLTVTAVGVSDYFGDAGSGILQTTWSTGTNVPVIVSVGAGNPTLRATPVTTVDVVLSEPINAASFTPAALSLTRDGGLNLINSGVSVTMVNPTTYRIGGLAALTTVDGNYVLTVNAAGLADGSGHSGVGYLAESWTITTVGPTISVLQSVIQSPRNVIVPTLDVTFSEAIDPTTLTYQNITYTKNGGANLINSQITITQLSPTKFEVGNFNNNLSAPVDGTYTFTVSAVGVVDLAGNSGTGTAADSWVLITTPPIAPTNLAISPDTGSSSSDGITDTGQITLSGTLATAGLTVDVHDSQSGADLGSATFAGTSFQLPLNLSSGTHQLLVTTIDLAGNTSAAASYSVTVDLSPPTIAFLSTVTPNPRDSAVSTLAVTFSKPIDPSTFDWHDLTLTRNGGPNLVTSAVTVALVSGTTYQIAGLSPLTTLDGAYVLTVNAPSITDLAGNLGLNSVATSWVMDTTTPATPTNLTITPNTGVSPGLSDTGSVILSGSLVGSVQTVDVFDATANVDLGHATLVNSVFSLALNLAAGTHQLVVTASSPAGNTSNPATFTVVVDETAPTATIAPVSPNSRTTPVNQITIVFSKPVVGLTSQSLSLALAGGPNLLTGSQTLTTTDNITFTLGNLAPLTAVQGQYTLTLTAARSGITDLTGNPLATSPTTTWQLFTSLAVSSFNPTTTGFTAGFDEPFVLALLNLYDTATAGFGPADVTLVGASTGPVRGSLIVSPGNQAITFVQTGGILAPDTYTVTFRSAANGFVDASGNLLAGNGTPGDNYTTTFTVAPSAARVVSLPDFARGPGQAFNVPATGAGLPLTISDGTGVTSISLKITYNPSLLTITGVNLGASAPAGASVSINTATPGLAVVTFTSPTALPAGLASFASLVASVPVSAPYASKEVLVIGTIAVNGGAIAATDDDAVDVVAYFGDTSGNGGYSGQDANLISRVAVNLDSGFAAFPLLDPLIVGDIAGRGHLSGVDANDVSQFSVNLPMPLIPALPGVTITRGGPDPLLWIGQDQTGAPGSTLTVPVMFRQTNRSAIGLDAADVAIEFDPNVFVVTGVRLGDVPKGWTLVESVDNATGAILAQLRSTTGAMTLPPGFAGSLLLIDLAVRPGASLGASRLNLLGEGRVGNMVLYTSLNDGGLTLVPAPTDSDTDSTDGVVTIGSPTLAPPTAIPIALNGGQLAVLSLSIPGLTVLPLIPPTAVDLAIEATHGADALANRLGLVAAFDLEMPVSSVPSVFVPWTTTDSSAGVEVATEIVLNPTTRKARNSRVILAQPTPRGDL